MINKFMSGLGIIEHPMDVGGHVSISQVERIGAPGGTLMNIVVDHAARALLGNMHIPSYFNWYNPPDQDPVTIVPSPVPISAPLPRPLSAIGKVASSRQRPGPVRFVPAIQPQVFSADSSPAPFETLHHEFQVKTIPFYNFWTPDETTNDKEDRGDRSLDDVPRFIKVVWSVAPNLDSGQKRVGGDLSRKETKPVKFGLEAERPFTITIKGVEFTPDHLQPHNFSDVVAHLANGHIFPGVIHANVEMPLHNTGLDSHMVHSQRDPIHHIDEDAFLTHPSTRGVSIHELRANVHQLTNGMLGAARISQTPISRAGSLDHDSFFAGKFSVAPSIFGELQIHGVNPGGPVLSLSSNTARSSEGEKFDHVFDMVRNVWKPQSIASMKRLAQIKVNFIHPSIGGVVRERKTNLMSEPHHAESVVAVAQMLPKLEILSQSGILDLPRKAEMPSYPSPPGLLPLEYVGYVLEKYRQGDSGAFELVETILLPSRDYDSYVDCKVAYGRVYRYRIKVILRWTHMNDMLTLKKRLLDRSSSVSTKSLSPYESSYFAGQWCQEWAYGSVLDTVPPEPPDELIVRPESARKRIAITFKLPDNPQRDIYTMRLFRKLQDKDGHDLTGWEQLYDHNAVDRKIDFAPQNVLYYDSEFVDYYQSNGIRYVYTAQCISRHHEVSAFSDQLAARLSRDFSLRGELPVEFVSYKGVKPEHFGAFSTYPHKTFKTEIIAIPPAKEPTKPERPVMFSFAGRNVKGNQAMDDALYFLRVESLDTGEKQDVQLNISYNTQKSQVDTLTVGVYVPAHSIEVGSSQDAPIYGENSKIGQLGDKGKDAEVSRKPLPPGTL